MQRSKPTDRGRIEAASDGVGLIETYLRELGYGATTPVMLARTLMREAGGDIRKALLRAAALPGPDASWRSLPQRTVPPLLCQPQDITPISFGRLMRRGRSARNASANDD